jgi:hypothetical protein
VPATELQAEKRKRTVADLRQMRRRYNLKGTTAKELIAEGRR